MSQPTQGERDRAARLGRLAAGAGRGLGGACPYRPKNGPKQRVLAAVFTRAYFAAGGTVDGIDYGGGSSSTSTRRSTPAASSSTSTRTSTSGGRHRAGPAYGGLGYLQ